MTTSASTRSRSPSPSSPAIPPRPCSCAIVAPWTPSSPSLASRRRTPPASSRSRTSTSTSGRARSSRCSGRTAPGKTTLISIICGIVTPIDGRVLADGHDIQRDYRAARAKIGLVPQELTTDAFESVWATVTFSRGLFGRAARRRLRREGAARPVAVGQAQRPAS